MKYVKVTAFIEGEVIIAPEVPLFCLGFMRWLIRAFGATISVSSVMDTRHTPPGA